MHQYDRVPGVTRAQSIGDRGGQLHPGHPTAGDHHSPMLAGAVAADLGGIPGSAAGHGREPLEKAWQLARCPQGEAMLDHPRDLVDRLAAACADDQLVVGETMFGIVFQRFRDQHSPGEVHLKDLRVHQPGPRQHVCQRCPGDGQRKQAGHHLAGEAVEIVVIICRHHGDAHPGSATDPAGQRAVGVQRGVPAADHHHPDRFGGPHDSTELGRRDLDPAAGFRTAGSTMGNASPAGRRYSGPPGGSRDHRAGAQARRCGRSARELAGRE